MIRTLSFFLIIVQSVSCGKSQRCLQNYTCRETFLVPLFIGYDRSDIDTVILYSYLPDSSFSSLTSSRVFTAPDSVFVYNNTPGYVKNGFHDLAILSGHDYKIFIPKTGQTFKIYGIVDTGQIQTGDCGSKAQCVTTIANIKVSGGIYEISTPSVLGFKYLNLYK